MAIRGEDIERRVRLIARIPLQSSSAVEFGRRAQAQAVSSRRFLGSDAVVYSLSGAGGFALGAGAGVELVCFSSGRWAAYLQGGGGFVTPGGAGAFEVGLVWNVPGPDDYTGWFSEVSGSFGISGSGFVEPDPDNHLLSASDLADLVNGDFERPCGFKLGVAAGSPGGSLLWEYYWMLTSGTFVSVRRSGRGIPGSQTATRSGETREARRRRIAQQLRR